MTNRELYNQIKLRGIIPGETIINQLFLTPNICRELMFLEIYPRIGLKYRFSGLTGRTYMGDKMCLI